MFVWVKRTPAKGRKQNEKNRKIAAEKNTTQTKIKRKK